VCCCEKEKGRNKKAARWKALLRKDRHFVASPGEKGERSPRVFRVSAKFYVPEAGARMKRKIPSA